MRGAIRRTVRAASLAGLLLFHSGCVFQRDWRASQCCPTVAEGIEGPWEGRWKSEATGREGRVKAVVTRTGDATYVVQFQSTKLGVIPSNLDVPMQVSFEDRQYVFSGEVDRNVLAGGSFQYAGYANREHFHTTYKTERDHGVFELTRVGPTIDCSPCDDAVAQAKSESSPETEPYVSTAGHTVPEAAPGPDTSDRKSRREIRRSADEDEGNHADHNPSDAKPGRLRSLFRR
jgi:hypothetical protein